MGGHTPRAVKREVFHIDLVQIDLLYRVGSNRHAHLYMASQCAETGDAGGLCLRQSQRFDGDMRSATCHVAYCLCACAVGCIERIVSAQTFCVFQLLWHNIRDDHTRAERPSQEESGEADTAGTMHGEPFAGTKTRAPGQSMPCGRDPAPKRGSQHGG